MNNENKRLPKMLTVKDIQEHLHIGHNKVYALIRLKGFPKIKIGGTYFIPED
jgi:hypothetical protein